jgi:hypothetical protein
MSAFTYDGPRNVLCPAAPMSGHVRIQPTPELTPNLYTPSRCALGDSRVQDEPSIIRSEFGRGGSAVTDTQPGICESPNAFHAPNALGENMEEASANQWITGMSTRDAWRRSRNIR